MPYLTLTALFIAIHLLYYQTGVRFDAEPLYLNWQYLDADLLRNNLSQSLLYLHSQPPLFNLMIGLVLKLAPSNFAAVFSSVFAALGLCLYLGLYRILRLAGCGLAVSILTATLFCATPSFLLYEHTLFYPLPVAVILVLAAISLHHFALSQKAAAAMLFFFLLFLLCAVSSQFQLPYFLLVLLMLLFTLKTRKQIVLAAALPLLLVLLLYAKNWLIFGKFATSTWLGMNLMHNLAEAIPANERQQMIKDGVLSKAMQAPSFSPLESYLFLPEQHRFSGIAALSRTEKEQALPHPDQRMRVNFNHYSYINISDLYLQDFLILAKRFPDLLLKRHDGSWQRYFTPSTFRAVSGENLKLMAPIIRFFDKYVYLQLQLGPPVGPQKTPQQIFLTLLAGLPLLFGYGMYLVSARESMDLRPGGDVPRRLMLSFMLFTIFYLTFVGNIIECGENNRFRFALDPFFFVLLGMALEMITTKVRAYYRRA